MTPALSSVENHQGCSMLALHFADGTVAHLPHARLRGACPCSQCRALRRAGQAVSVDADVGLLVLEPVGLYALNLKFSDGHERGIYPFQMLVGLGADEVPEALAVDGLAFEARSLSAGRVQSRRATPCTAENP